MNLADPELHINWPIPLEESERSEADLHHPMLKDAKPMAPKRTLITGCNGQLGRAIKDYAQKHDLEGFEYVDLDSFDISNKEDYSRYDWDLYGTIINTAAYTAVDKAETPEGRRAAWRSNVTGVANLAKIAQDHHITLIHISSDYVFDGNEESHKETEEFSPLGVYGQTKAAADALVANVPQHYIIRSSWIVGEGHNFVTRMIDLAKSCNNGENVSVQAPVDQVGRLTFTSDLVEGIFHLLNTNAEYGTYNLTCSGKPASWYEIAEKIFKLVGANTSEIEANRVDDYTRISHGSPRPHHCSLDLSKIESTGFKPENWEQLLETYVKNHNE